MVTDPIYVLCGAFSVFEQVVIFSSLMYNFENNPAYWDPDTNLYVNKESGQPSMFQVATSPEILDLRVWIYEYGFTSCVGDHDVASRHATPLLTEHPLDILVVHHNDVLSGVRRRIPDF